MFIYHGYAHKMIGQIVTNDNLFFKKKSNHLYTSTCSWSNLISKNKDISLATFKWPHVIYQKL